VRTFRGVRDPLPKDRLNKGGSRATENPHAGVPAGTIQATVPAATPKLIAKRAMSSWCRRSRVLAAGSYPAGRAHGTDPGGAGGSVVGVPGS